MGARTAVFTCLLAAVAAALSACGNSGQGLGPPPREKAPVGEETAYIQDNVLVTFRQTRTTDFQTTTLFWNGSVQNLGDTVPNTRFEILVTRGPIQHGALQTQVTTGQAFGDLLPGEQHLLHASFTFSNVVRVGISTRLAHD